VYVGAGVLAWTAVKMITAEPFVKDWFIAEPLAAALLYLAIIPGVLWAGFVKNHRRLESRIHARLAKFAQLRAAANAPVMATTPSSPSQGGSSMLRILIPVDGSPNAENAVRQVVNDYMKSSDVEIHLLNVQPLFSQHISMFVAKRHRDEYHREQADTALRSARDLLDRFRVPYHTHMGLGDRAKVITDTARDLNCHHIVMGTARKNSLTRMLEDSVTNKVLELTTVPVEVVAGTGISKLERYGIPAAGLGIGLGLLLLAVE